MDIKVTKPDSEEDVNMDVSTVFTNIYSSCDVENTNAVCVSRLIEFIRPFMMEDLVALEELRESLDPEKKDPPISGEIFKEHMAKWSQNLAGSPESESDFNRTPSQLNLIDERELPYMHSTPRASLGDKLLRCKDLLNLSNVSGYSLSTSKLEATNNVDPDKTILEEEIKRLQHQLSKTLNELTMVKQQLAASEECNDTMQSDIDRLNRRLVAEQQVNEHLQKDKAYSEELRDEINMHRRTIDDLKKKLSCYDNEIQDLKNAMIDLEEEKLKVEKKLDHLSWQKQDILKENFELTTKLETHQQQMAEIKRINDELKMRFSEQKDLIDQLRDENDILNHQKVILEKALKGKSSSSPLEQDSPSPPLGTTTDSHNSSGEENYWRYAGQTSKNRPKSESLQTEISKVDPSFASDSTALFEKCEQIFLLEGEMNNLKKSLNDLLAEKQKLSQELKKKADTYEELLASNFVLATNLETTKSKVDHLNDLLAEKNPNKLHSALTVDKEIQVDTDDSVVKELARDLQEQIKRAVEDESKSSQQMAEFMRSFGQLTMEKTEIENNFVLLHEEKKRCKEHFKSKLHSVEQKLIEQENAVQKLNEYTSTVVKENERLEKCRVSLAEEVFCLKSSLEVSREKNQNLLECITNLQDENHRNQSKIDDLQNKLKAKETEVDNLTRSVKDLKRQSDESDVKLKLKNQEVINLKETLKVQEDTKKKVQYYEQKIEQKEHEIDKLKATVEQISKVQESETHRNAFELILKEKEQEISKLKESLNISLKEELETQLRFELECKIALKEEESNWIKDNLVRQLKTDYEDKIKTKEEEMNKLKSDFLQQIKLKDDETVQFREGLEKRMMHEFEEKLKHSIDGEEQMFTLTSRCESLEKSLSTRITMCEDLQKELDSVQNSLQQMKSVQEELKAKTKEMDEARTKIVMEKSDVENQLKCLRTEYENKCLQHQSSMEQLNKDLLRIKSEFEEKLSLQNQEIKDLNINLDNKIKELHNAEQKIVSLTQKCEYLQKDLNSALHNLYDKTDVCEKVSSDWQKVESELKAMFASKMDLEQTVIDLKIQVETLTKEKLCCDTLSQKLKQKEIEVDELNAKLSSVSISYENLKKIKTDLENNIQNLEKDLSIYKLKNVDLIDINNNKTEQLESLNSLLNEEKRNNIKNKAEIEQVKDLLEENISQLHLSEKEVDRISDELKETKILLKSAESENSKLFKSLSDLRKRNLIKENSLKSLNGELEEEKNKNSMYIGEIALKDQEIKRISLHLSQVKSSLEQSETAYQNLLKDAEAKEQLNIDLKNEIIQQKLSTECSLESSNSSGNLQKPVERKTNFSKQQITIDRLKERLENFEDELRIEKRKNNQLTLELEKLRNNLRKKEDEVISLSTKIISLDDIKSKLSCEEAKTAYLNEKLLEMDDKLKNITDQKEKLQGDLRESDDLKKEELLKIQENIETAKAELDIFEKLVLQSKNELETARKELQATREILLKLKEEEITKCEGKNKNKFTLRGPHSDVSRPTSPDSPSNDFEVNGLPDMKVIYQSSNSESVVIEIPNLIFYDLSDQFLEEIGLNEQSPRKKFTKDETEKKVTTLALRLLVNSKDIGDRFEKQKHAYKNKYEEFLSLTTDISHRLRDHVCIGTNEPISPVFILLEELKLRVKSLAQSATEIGILAYENRMKRCWNLVTNYMAMLRKENELLSGQYSNVETTPTQTLRRRLTNANVGNDESIIHRLEPRRSLASKCRCVIYAMSFLAFLMTASVAFHLYCRLTVSETQSCPLDDFISRQVTGIPPM